MRSLFPEMERELRDDRKAEHREAVQRARDYLRNRDLSWLINHLLEHGPTSEHVLMMKAMDENHFKDAAKNGADVLGDLFALWLIRKVWRKQLGVHPGSGEMSYLYGLKGVHASASQSTEGKK